MFLGGLNSLVIRQKSESQHGCFKKTKQAKFSEKRTFLTSLFFGKFVMLSFLKTPVLRFVLLPYSSPLWPSCPVNHQLDNIGYLAGIYLLIVNNRNTRTRCEICSKLTIKTPERRLASFWCLYC